MNQAFRFVKTAGAFSLVGLAFLACELSVFADGRPVSALHHRWSTWCCVLMLVLVILAGVGVIAFVRWASRQSDSSKPIGNELARTYVTSLMAMATLLPAVAAVSTVLIFLTGRAGTCAPFFGSAIALFMWFVSPTFCWGLADAKHAFPSSYGEVCQRLDQLKERLKTICTASPGNPSQQTACQQAGVQATKIEADFKIKGLPWILAVGYVNAWKRLHRAEESLIEVVPAETVIAWALYDEMRLQGSNVNNSADLLAKLRQAVDAIDPCAKKYFKAATALAAPVMITTPSPLVNGCVGADYSQTLTANGGTPPYVWSLSQSALPNGMALSASGALSGRPTKDGIFSFTVRVTDSASVTATKALNLTVDPQAASSTSPPQPAPATSGGCGADPKTLARAVLRTVRRAINEFRDDRWSGMVVARNRLFGTMIFTGLTAYALLAIAIISGAPKTAIAAASAFYLVGATIGLLSRLRSESQSDSGVEDYGLSTARLITLPLFSGLAAIGGVVLMAMLPGTSAVLAPVAPLTITTASTLTTGVVGTAYSQTLQATGGTPPYSWSAAAVPEGFKLSATGELTAQPTAPVTTNFTAQVSDSTGLTAKKLFILTVDNASAESSGRGSPPAKTLASPSVTRIPPLEDIFDLRKNVIGLLLAAVFGLTPGLLFDRLQQQADRYKADLKSSEATQAATRP
jgi:hypothetical protein